jgi:hypothetical protein
VGNEAFEQILQLDSPEKRDKEAEFVLLDARLWLALTCGVFEVAMQS